MYLVRPGDGVSFSFLSVDYIYFSCSKNVYEISNMG